MAGRPKKYNEVEEMQIKIDQYFKDCDNRKKTIFLKTGKNIKVADPEPYTVCGLALALEMDRSTLIEYSKDDKFSNTIKKAKLKIEKNIELRSMESPYTTGCIFNLKNNFGWKEMREVELSGGEKPIKHEIKSLTLEERIRQLEEAE